MQFNYSAVMERKILCRWLCAVFSSSIWNDYIRIASVASSNYGNDQIIKFCKKKNKMVKFEYWFDQLRNSCCLISLMQSQDENCFSSGVWRGNVQKVASGNVNWKYPDWLHDNDCVNCVERVGYQKMMSEIWSRSLQTVERNTFINLFNTVMLYWLLKNISGFHNKQKQGLLVSEYDIQFSHV